MIKLMISQAAFDSHNKANPPKPNMYTLHRSDHQLYLTLFKIQWLLPQLDWAFGSPALRVPMGSRLRCVPLSQVLARDQSTHPSIPSGAQLHIQICSFMQSLILIWLIAYLDQYFGSAILALAVAAACMGHLEKMIWSNMAGVREIFCISTLWERYNCLFFHSWTFQPLFFGVVLFVDARAFLKMQSANR